MSQLLTIMPQANKKFKLSQREIKFKERTNLFKLTNVKPYRKFRAISIAIVNMLALFKRTK